LLGALVEAPGTAPGSEWFIATALYFHSRRTGRLNIEGKSPEKQVFGGAFGPGFQPRKVFHARPSIAASTRRIGLALPRRPF
jgi:hypothetical protein